MKIRNVYIWVFLLIGALMVSGCYTQLKLEDDDYAYKKERKRVIIEKRVEEKDGETVESVDTTYESTDDYGYDEEEDHYYYPKHRRAYKFYHPGITIVVGGAVYYDPWYFDYFYYPYTICRTYYLPWWYGYYSCYRVWYGFAYYDPFYNPFYAPPYWWYDPYWYGGYYPPIVQYRKNDYTRLRDQDGGRSGLVRTGNFGRDLNLQVASERSKLRDADRSTIRTTTGRERNSRIDTDLKIPSSRDRGATIDRDRTTSPNRSPESTTGRKETIRDRSNDRQTPPPPQVRTPAKNPDRGREKIDNRSRDMNDRESTPPSRRYDTFIPRYEQREINIDDRKDEIPSKRNNDSNVRSYRSEKIIIEYDVPRREYTSPRYEEKRKDYRESTSPNVNRNQDDNSYRNSSPIYEPRRNETPRYEAPRYETPRYDPPSRNSFPSYTPRSSNPSPSPQAPARDRRNDR